MSGARRRVAHLLLLLLIVRALVPAGYMPDFSAAADGVFKVVICSANGGQALDLAAGEHQLPDPQHANLHDDACVFAGLAAVAMPALSAIAIVGQDYQTSAFIPREAVQLPPARAGPVLGSRGPPQIS